MISFRTFQFFLLFRFALVLSSIARSTSFPAFVSRRSSLKMVSFPRIPERSALAPSGPKLLQATLTCEMVRFLSRRFERYEQDSLVSLLEDASKCVKVLFASKPCEAMDH